MFMVKNDITRKARHGKPYVIKIDCQKMLADGCKFFLSNNGVWLTEKVSLEYFIDEG